MFCSTSGVSVPFVAFAVRLPVAFAPPPKLFGPSLRLNKSRMESCALFRLATAPPVSGATLYNPYTTALPMVKPTKRCTKPIFFACLSNAKSGEKISLIGISSSVRLGKIQKCSPDTIHTATNTTVLTVKTTANVPRMAKHTYRITFLNQIGANGNKHIATTKSANNPLSITLVQLIGG